MRVTLLCERWAIDGALDRNDPARCVPLRIGDYEMVRIRNPYGYHGDWLVIINTMIGAPETLWRDWAIKLSTWPPSLTPDRGVIIND